MFSCVDYEFLILSFQEIPYAFYKDQSSLHEILRYLATIIFYSYTAITATFTITVIIAST